VKGTTGRVEAEEKKGFDIKAPATEKRAGKNWHANQHDTACEHYAGGCRDLEGLAARLEGCRNKTRRNQVCFSQGEGTKENPSAIVR